jgi:hypothetical protein
MGGWDWVQVGVDAWWSLCYCVVVGGQFSGCRTSVFLRSLYLLVQWVDVWGGVMSGGLYHGCPLDLASWVEGNPCIPVGVSVGPQFLAGICGSPQKIRALWVPVALC